MGNPLFQALAGSMPSFPGPMGDMMQMMQQFQQFKNNFQGDPKAEVERLLQSGEMTQQQLDQLQGMAKQMMGFMGKG